MVAPRGTVTPMKRNADVYPLPMNAVVPARLMAPVLEVSWASLAISPAAKCAVMAPSGGGGSTPGRTRVRKS